MLSPYPYLQVSLDKLYQGTGLADVLAAMIALDDEVRHADAYRRSMPTGRRRDRS